jgi:hypothetical protein
VIRIAAILLLATAARAGEEWIFSFGNGDQVRGELAAIRNATVLVELPSVSRAVAVPFDAIAQAEPAPREAEGPRPEAQLLRLRDGAALLGWCRAVRQGKVEFETEALGTVTIPGRDVSELLPAADALRAYHRVLSAERTTALQPERFDALWSRLGSGDANVAWQAHRDLAKAGESAVPQLDARLRVQPDAPAVVAAWIRSLDADSAEVRLIAHARLRALGPAAQPHLKAALRGPTSAEARQRIGAILDAEEPPPPDAEVVRVIRAIRVLEEIGTPEAGEILGRLANGAPEAPTGREAEAALERLRRVR